MQETLPIDSPEAVEQQSNFIIKAFHDGGPVMYIILVIFVFTAYIAFQRWMALRRLTVNKADFSENLFGMIIRGDLRQAITFCDSRPIPFTNTMKAGLVQVLNKRPDEEVQVAMDAAVLRETPELEGWTSFLAVFGNLATLVGLFGTIVGLIVSFTGVSKADPAQKADLLSRGISEALNCTGFGLLTAILAITAYGYLQIKIERAVNDMVEGSMTLMNLVVSNRDKLKEK